MPETGQKLKPEPSSSDNELARRIQNSDEHAFKLLYTRYYEALFKFIWRRVRDDEAAKDLMQTLFIRVWKGRERLDASLTIKAYLYQVATNLVIDHFRQKGRRQSRFVAEPEVEPSEEPDDTFELEEVLVHAIDHLPQPLQQVFKLSRFKGMKNSEIAKNLGVSIKTVESRMTKAFTILRELLKPLLSVVLFFRFFFKS